MNGCSTCRHLVTVAASLVLGLLAASLVRAVVEPEAAGSFEVSREVSESECLDSAEALSGRPDNEGEPSVVVPQISEDRLVAAWASGPKDMWKDEPIGGNAVLAQRDPKGKWTEEVLSEPDWISGDIWLDTSPNDGAVYVSYLRGGSALDLKAFVQRVIPGNPAEPRNKTGLAIDHPALVVDQLARGEDRLYLFGMDFWLRRGLLAISNDSGRNWQETVDFPKPLYDETGQFAPVAASGGDNMVVTWVEGVNFSDEFYKVIRVAKFDTLSGNFHQARNIAATPAFRALPFGADILPFISVVRGGPYEGRTYVVWPQRKDASSLFSDIMVSFSDDGLDWSTPKTANDNPSHDEYRVFPSVSAASDGSALITWMDSRDDPSKQSVLMYGAKIGTDGRIRYNHKLTSCNRSRG